MSQTQCYFISGSPPCWTVMLALGVKGVGYEPVRLSNTKGEQKAEAFRAVNPRGIWILGEQRFVPGRDDLSLVREDENSKRPDTV